MSRPSQKLIADKLGVSVATVSLALRGKGTISKQLSAKIRSMAEEVGYRPNPVLSSLASKRFRDAHAVESTPIAVIDFMNHKVGTDLYTQAIGVRAAELGYNLQLISAADLTRYNSPCQTLYNRGVQGLIIIGPVESAALRENFDWSLFSVIQCGRFLDPLPFDTVRPNIFQFIKQAYRIATERGYRRIGFGICRHNPPLEDDESRLYAALGLQFLDESLQCRLPPFLGWIYDLSGFVKWAKEHRPDCVIGFSIAQCAALIENGFRVPEDLGFICLHLEGPQTLADKRNLKITGNHQNYAVIATQSMNLLDQKIQHHEKGVPALARQVLIDSSWIEGETLPNRER